MSPSRNEPLPSHSHPGSAAREGAMPAPIKTGRSQRLGEEPPVKTAAHPGHLKQKTSENVTLRREETVVWRREAEVGGCQCPQGCAGPAGRSSEGREGERKLPRHQECLQGTEKAGWPHRPDGHPTPQPPKGRPHGPQQTCQLECPGCRPCILLTRMILVSSSSACTLVIGSASRGFSERNKSASVPPPQGRWCPPGRGPIAPVSRHTLGITHASTSRPGGRGDRSQSLCRICGGPGEAIPGIY